MDLSPYWPLITETARYRLKNNVTDRHVADYGDEIEIMGVAGELAALIDLGHPIKLHVNFDGGIDFYHRGYSVDVKATKLTSKLNFRFLQWPHFKKVVADIIILSAVDIHNMNAVTVGYVTRDEIVRAPMNYSRRTPCREVPVEKMGPIWELMMIREKSFDHILKEREQFRNQQLNG